MRESVNKVPCLSCGAKILPLTAAKNDGRCAPCKRGTRTACRKCGAPAFREMRGVELDSLCGQCRAEEERHRPTAIERFVHERGSGDCALLVGLFKLDERLRRDGPDGFIGLNLIDPPAFYGSEATPRNSIAFAGTGGDDVHFGLVTVKGRVSDDCAVVMTCPDLSEERWRANVLVGRNLHEFLSLGCERGYDVLESLPYDREELLQQLRSGPDLEDEDAETAATLAEYRRELGLVPWTDVESRLVGLEARKRFTLRFSRFWPPWRR